MNGMENQDNNKASKKSQKEKETMTKTKEMAEVKAFADFVQKKNDIAEIKAKWEKSNAEFKARLDKTQSELIELNHFLGEKFPEMFGKTVRKVTSRGGRLGRPPANGGPTIKEQVLECLRNNPNGSRPSDVIQATGLKNQQVYQSLLQAHKAGEIERDDNNLYHIKLAE